MKISLKELGTDPNGWRINCCSFQQDAIITYGKYQYVALYVPEYQGNPNSNRLTCLGRREISKDNWNFLNFPDYIQTKDDGHNIISMGISGDGVIHLAWDMHGDGIHYRQSEVGLALNENNDLWSITSFGQVETYLSGHDKKKYIFDEITYPRFLTLASGDMLLEFRIGRSGLGDEYIYKYCQSSHRWKEVAAPYIKGIENNAYIHGFDLGSLDNCLHVSWTYRDFVEDRNDEIDSKGTSQAGPNGPENNHDLHYIYSLDEGTSWYNGEGKKLELPITSSSPTLAVEIPKYSGIMNQEGQCVDNNGGFHVLGREFGYYHHYYRNPITGNWLKRKINNYQGNLFGARGKILPAKTDFATVYALIPLEEEKFIILKSTVEDSQTLSFKSSDNDWTIIESFEGYDGEPLYDRYRNDGVVSILQRMGGCSMSSEDNLRKIVLIDLKAS